MSHTKAYFEDKTLETIARVEKICNVSLNNVCISFENLGTTGARAIIKRYNGGAITRDIIYNSQLLDLSHTKIDIILDLIRHEVAHLAACEMGSKGHDKTWKNVHYLLGGSGNRTLSIGLEPLRKVKRYLHVSPNDKNYVITSYRYNKLLSGKVLAYLAEDGYRLTKSLEYKQL